VKDGIPYLSEGLRRDAVYGVCDVEVLIKLREVHELKLLSYSLI